MSFKLSKEIKTLFIVAIVLALIFAFNDKKPSFNLSDWLSNFILTLILVIIVLLVHLIGIKLASSYFHQESTFKLWSIKQFSFAEKRHLPVKFPLGIIAALLTTLISQGTLFFTAVSTFKVTPKKIIGRTYPNVSEREIAYICIWSLISNVILLIIFKFLNIQEGVLINSWFILWNMLPIADLIGSQIFFGFRIMYFFSLFFVIIFLLLISVLSAISTLMISLLFAFVLIIVYAYYREYWRLGK